jgi:hypothetical protein
MTSGGTRGGSTIGRRKGETAGLESNSSTANITKPDTGMKMSAASALSRGMAPFTTAMIAMAASILERTMI